MTSTGLLNGVDGAERILDPDFGAALASDWVAQRRPDRFLQRATTHSVLYRGQGDVSARISIELGAEDGPVGAAEALTLLIRAQDGTMTVTEFPDDPALPSLAMMLDPRSALEVLMRAAPELSVGSSPRVGIRCDVALVHHPRTGACVVRYDVTGTEKALRRVYAKIYPSAAQARSSAVAHEALGGRLLQGDAVVRLPRLLGLDLDTRSVLIESLDPQDPQDSQTATALAHQAVPTHQAVPAPEAAQVLRTLHAATPPGGLPKMTAEDEVNRVRDELAVVRTRWPGLAARVAAQVDTAAQCLGRSDEGSPVVSHGDFTPSQLLRVTPHVIGLVDLDTLCRAEAAADLGRFLAYSALRQARRAAPGRPPAGPVTSEMPGLRATVLDAYGPIPGDAPLDRVLAHERLQLALVALRATRRFKEERIRLALTLLDHASSRRPS